MSGLVAVYLAVSTLLLIGLVLVCLDWWSRKREKHAH